MPKVFGMHEIELQPGVSLRIMSGFAEELAPTLKLPGWKTHLLRGDRGARSGKYLVLHEGESLDARDRYFPGPGEQSEGFTRFLEQHPETAAAMEKWERSQSTRKTTLRPITSPSLNSAFYSYPGTRDTAGRPALPCYHRRDAAPCTTRWQTTSGGTQQLSACRLDVTDTGRAGRVRKRNL
jgi:hypothetical protein